MADMTTKLLLRKLLNRLRRLCASERGNIAVIFAIALVPLITGLGAAIDYSRANATKDSVQAALDSALLAGAKDGGSTWITLATDVFNSNLSSRTFSVQPPQFTKDDATLVYAGTASASVPTSLLGIIGIRSVAVSVQGQATAGEGDNSCILTLDKGQSKSHTSLTLNGAPVVNLTGCSIRSNTSMNCNGHNGNAIKSYASGTVWGCSGPKSNAPIVPDMYVDLATNITAVCSPARLNVKWTAGGAIPPGITTVIKAGYTEYHICGDLTVSGSGHLTGSAPATDRD